MLDFVMYDFLLISSKLSHIVLLSANLAGCVLHAYSIVLKY